MPRHLDNLGSEDLVPTVNRSATPDVSRVQPADWSVLGLIDGRRTLAAICQAAPLTERDAVASLIRLRDLGMIALPTPKPPPLASGARAHSGIRAARTSPPAQPARTKADKPQEKPRKGAVRIPPPKGWPTPMERFSFDPARLDEAVDLDPEKRRQILYWHHHLEAVDYYLLFQVERGADERALRRAYFALSKEFHPDQFFRRELGSYEPLIGDIFRWIAGANEILSHPEKRRRYDALLARGYKGEWEVERAAQAQTSRPEPAAPSSNPRVATPAHSSGALGAVVPGVSERLEDARRLMEARRWRDALNVLEPLLQPTFHPRVAVAAARCLLELGERPEVADDLCRRALREAGLTQIDKRDALIVLGGLFERAGRLEDAKKLIGQALRLDPRNANLKDHLERLERNARG